MGKQSRRCREMSGCYVIRVVKLEGYVSRFVHEDINDKYIHSVPDLDRPCSWKFTTNPRMAKRFPTSTAAYDYYHRQSIHTPLRADGEPNRPLRAFTVLVKWVE